MYDALVRVPMVRALALVAVVVAGCGQVEPARSVDGGGGAVAGGGGGTAGTTGAAGHATAGAGAAGVGGGAGGTGVAGAGALDAGGPETLADAAGNTCPSGTAVGAAWGSTATVDGRRLSCANCGAAAGCVVVRQPETFDVWCASAATSNGCAF